MISKHARIGFSVVAGLAVTAAIGCGGDGGDDVPNNAIATVGDRAITRAAFKSQLASYAENDRPLQFDPPRFDRCAAARRAKQPAPEGKEPPELGRFRAECRREYEQLQDRAVGVLIEQTWITEEARREGVSVPERKVRRVFGALRKNAFPEQSKYQEYLRRTGLKESTLVAQIRSALADQALDEHVQGEVGPPSGSEIAAYYKSHREEFRSPTTRDLHAVIAGTKAAAVDAKQALANGESWPSVVRRYSLDKPSIKTGGEVTGYVGGAPFSGNLDSVVARARRGVVTGPVKTQFTWWVFKVDNVTPSKQLPLSKVSARIKDQLIEKNKQKALADYSNEFRLRYRAMTVCAEAFEVPACKNGPKRATTEPTRMTDSN